MRLLVAILLSAFAAIEAAAATKVSLCELQANPDRYDRQLVEVTTFVSHGFEDFSVFDPSCIANGPVIWLDYGGDHPSDTIWCCDHPAGTRVTPLIVDMIPTTIVRDRQLERFDDFIDRDDDVIVHATIRGHFFAGEKTKLPGGTRWTGFGHFGLFSLLVIEQVVSVDPHDLPNVDYRATSNASDFDDDDVTFIAQRGGTSYPGAIEEQVEAEIGIRSSAFTEPARVAAEGLRATAGTKPGLLLRVLRAEPGRIVFETNVEGKQNKYRVVVSRPYWLSFSAKNRQRVVWVMRALWESGCDNGS